MAFREWLAAPCGLLETIIEYRAFAAAYRIVSTAKSRKDIPDDPMCQTVQEIEFALAQEELGL